MRLVDLKIQLQYLCCCLSSLVRLSSSAQRGQQAGYLITTFEKFGFADNFIEWVKQLYTSPKALNVPNGNRSRPFLLQCGVHQGNPLSPLLFNIALEPLAVRIRNKLILLTWKSTTPPCYTHWLKEMLLVIPVEKLCQQKPNKLDSQDSRGPS